MLDKADLNQTLIHLFAERQAYVSRLWDLAHALGRAVKADGYLQLIDGVIAVLPILTGRGLVANDVSTSMT